MSHTHLTLEERVAIELFVHMGRTCREIATQIGRNHTTILRELHRNSSKSGYRAQTVDRRARKRRKIPRHYRCLNRPELITYVDEKLRRDWSPEQISGRMRLEYPKDTNMRISTETIYRWIYVAAQFGGTSFRHLRRGHRRRRRQIRYGRGRCRFPGRIDIAHPPQIVADRARFGDWEADLVCASQGKAALLTCNERKSRFLLLGKVEDKTAASFNDALIPRLRALPAELRQSLTLDNGSEMARFTGLEASTGISTYFCRPYSPWQRGPTRTAMACCDSIFQE
ncbi:MAG: IS30 family transposase [Desulfobulbaceae bacterium]|nr:IS30 family transposase [Desulfobulbaceae bacterium]